MAKITIITINRNNSKGLDKTIRSVIEQSYTNYEYIIIDGASTDESIEVIKKYAENINYWVSEPDKGIYDAMNKAIDRASGEWICFMNSGDSFYNQNALNDIFEKESDNISGFDVIYGNTVMITRPVIFLSIPVQLDLMPIDKPFCHQSVFVRLNVQKAYKFNLDYKICADYDFFLSLYKNGFKFKYIDCIVACFDTIDSFSANDSWLVVEEHCRIKGIHSKVKVYSLIIKKKFRRGISSLLDWLCCTSTFFLNLKKKKMRRKADIGWVKDNTDYLTDYK